MTSLCHALRFLILLTVASALQAQNIGSEIAVTETRVEAPAPVGFGGWAIAATDDAGYVMWTDFPNLYGMQLHADGEPLLNTRTLLGPYTSIPPADVVAARDAFYAVWFDGTSVHIHRSDDKENAIITDRAEFPRLRWNGSHFLLTYIQGAHLYGLFLDPQIRRAVGARFTIAEDLAPVGPAIASAGGSFVVVWNGRDARTHLSRVDDDGTVTPTARTLPYVATYLSVATSGNDYLIVGRSGIYGDGVDAARIDTNGAIVGDIFTVEPVGSHVSFNPTVVWNGANYLVVWLAFESPAFPTIVARSVSAAKIGPREIIEGGRITEPRIVGAGTKPFLAWLGGFGNNDPLLGHRIGDPNQHVITRGASNQQSPTVASDGFEAVAVWSEDGQLMAGRIRLDGVRIDPVGILVARLQAQFYAPPARIAFDGVNYLIIWEDNGVVYGRFFSAAGKFLGDSFRVSPGSDAASVDVAWLGDRYFIVWGGSSPGAATSTTSAIVTPVQLFGRDEPVRQVAIARADDHTALVAYISRSLTDAVATLSTLHWRAGSVATRSAVATVRDTYTANPKLASNGTDFILTWTDQAGPFPINTAYVARLNRDGALVGEPVALLRTVGPYRSVPLPSAFPIFDGIRYGVLASAYPTVEYSILTDDTFTCHCLITHDIGALFPPGLDFRRLGVTDTESAGNGKIIFAYNRVAVDPVIAMRWRAFLRVIDTPASAPRRRAM